MHAAGIPVPTPRYLEPMSPETPDAFYILDYCDGRPELAPSDLEGFIEQYVQRLAQLHRVDWRAAGLTFLRNLDDGRPDHRSPGTDRLRVHEIRHALLRPPNPRRANADVLLHGDFWPGNLLWRDGTLVAIIDWEESIIGEPLFDLAICRLDLLWVVGMEAVDRFTERYRSQTDVELTNLPYWDLLVSLRPIKAIEQWADAYPHMGRPDVTVQRMAADHQAFVERALRRWG